MYKKSLTLVFTDDHVTALVDDSPETHPMWLVTSTDTKNILDVLGVPPPPYILEAFLKIAALQRNEYSK